MDWILIKDIFKLKLKTNKQYLVCVENWNGHNAVWHMAVALWYEEGDELILREPDNTPHKHNIKKTGFYVVHDCGEDRYRRIYRLSDVKYYIDVELPKGSPDDFLIIEN